MSNDSFRIHGVSYADFPLIYDDKMRLLREAHLYLVYQCIRNGRAQSRRTWARYGQDLYDFFGFVLANGHDWRARPAPGLPGVVEAYRDWAVGECGLGRGTVNQRLRTVRSFYVWAHRHGLVDAIPFDDIAVATRQAPRFLEHTGSRTRTQSSHLMLRKPRIRPHFLSLEECRDCIKALFDPSHRLIFRLAVQSGLRNEELRTFPEKYVVDPMTDARWKGKASRLVALSHKDMELKGSKDRDIGMTETLMADLWEYSVYERPRRAALRESDVPNLFLTVEGTTFSASTMQSMFRALSGRVKFKVFPHLLRHTYATHTLYELHKRGFKSDSLLYLSERLGHTHIYTTEVYLHLLQEIEAGLVELHEDELDKMFREA